MPLHRRWRFLSACAGLALTIATVVALGASSGSSAGWSAKTDKRATGRQNQKPLTTFPLEVDVPVKKYAVLRRSVDPSTYWKAFAFRAPPAESNRSGGKACIAVGGVSKRGEYQFTGDCGPLSPVTGETESPVYTRLSTVETLNGKRTGGETVIAMSTSTEVARLTLDLEPGPPISAKTRLFDSTEAAKINLRPFRFIAVAIPRQVCVQGATGTSRAGAIVLKASGFECPLKTGPPSADH